MRTSILGAIAGLTLLTAAPAEAMFEPPDTQPGADELWLLCAVTDQATSNNCRFYMPITKEEERLKAGTELGYLDAHPFPISGATPGSDVKVYVRLNAAKLPGGGYKVTAPENAFLSSSGAEIVDPVWSYSPFEQWAGLFTPDTAVRLNKPGQATVRCVATLTGALVNCWIRSEAPAGWGFGESATRLLAHVRMKPLTASDHTAGGRPFEITLDFY